MSETGDAGRAGAFLKFGLGARALGMGGAYVSIAEGMDAVYYNPGGLGFAVNKEVGFTYHGLTLDRHLNSASIIMPVRNEAVMALSWINSFVSNVDTRDSDRNIYGDLSNSDNSFGLSFSKRVTEDFSVGANLRYIQATLDVINSYTVGVDFGAMYKFQKNYAVGLSVNDLGSNYVWDSSNYWSGNRGKEYTDTFPVRVRGGASAKLLNDQLVTSVDIVKIEEIAFKLYAGAEYWFLKKVELTVEDEEAEDEIKIVQVNKRVLGVRSGYSDGSLTFGMSLYYPFGKFDGGFDYAFLTGKRDEGSNHVFTVRVMF